MSKKTNKGVLGDLARFEPFNDETTLLNTGEVVYKGKVTATGPKSVCKVGDVIRLDDWLIRKNKDGEKILYYAPNEAILEIL